MVISFFDPNFKGTNQNLHDRVVISVVTRNYIVRKLLVNQGSSVDIFYTSTLQKMQIPESSLTPYHGDLVQFSGKQLNVRGVVKLRTTLGTKPNIKPIGVRYLVIDS